MQFKKVLEQGSWRVDKVQTHLHGRGTRLPGKIKHIVWELQTQKSI